MLLLEEMCLTLKTVFTSKQITDYCFSQCKSQNRIRDFRMIDKVHIFV